METERNSSSFDKNEVSSWWLGSHELVQAKIRISAALEMDPDFNKIGPFHEIYRLSKHERYVKASERFSMVRQKMANGSLRKPPYSIRNSREYVVFQTLALGPDTHTLAIQHMMFIPTLKNQTSSEQRDSWLPAAEAMAIFGCYGQTEMAHGSDVKGLETEARYDPVSQTFDLHSPTVGSTKWWPAALGRTATHGIIHARLLLPENSKFRDFGVKPFFVQLRDLKTHKNLDGIESGDIGPTMGLIGCEEGWCRFEHVKIPLVALLARYGHVNPQGDWIPPTKLGSKRSYATMLLVRARFVAISSDFLGKAASIAVRYCAVRRQFKDNNGREKQVLDYQQVQMRTLPWVGLSYALKATGVTMMTMHREMEARVELHGDIIALAMEKEVHIVGSCLKAVCTTFAVDGIEELRRVCGGYGYSVFSGFQDLYGNAMVNFTGEGENYMIIQQASSALLKVYKSMIETGIHQVPSPNFAFIKPLAHLPKFKTGSDFMTMSLEDFVAVFEFRTVCLLAHNVEENSQWDGIQAAWAFGELLIVRSFALHVQRSDPKIIPILTVLCRLVAMYLMNMHMNDYLLYGYMQPADGIAISMGLKKLLLVVRPEAVSLVDCFGFTDRELNSALGNYDGNVYETLLEWAKLDPMNQTPVVEGFDEFYGKVLHEGRGALQKMGKDIEKIDGIIQRRANL